MRMPLKHILLRVFPRKKDLRGYIEVPKGPRKKRDFLKNPLVVAGVIVVVFAILAVSIAKTMSFQKVVENQKEITRTLREMSDIMDDFSQKVAILEQRSDLYVSREELGVTIETTIRELSKGIDSKNSRTEGSLERRIDALEKSVQITAKALQENVQDQLADLSRKQEEIFREDAPESLEEIAGLDFEEPESQTAGTGMPLKFSQEFAAKTERDIEISELTELYSVLNQFGGLSSDQSVLSGLQERIVALATGDAEGGSSKRVMDPKSHGVRDRSSVLDGGVDEREGWTVGTRFPGILETGLASVKGGCIAKIRLEKPVLYKGYTIIPAGSSFVGYAEPDWTSRRLVVTLTKLVIENVEYPVNASMEDTRGRPGVADKVIEPESLAASKATLPMWAAALLRAAAGVTITEISAAAGVVGTISETESDLDTGYLAASDWFAQQAQLQYKAASKRPPLILANPGTQVNVVLLEKLPIALFGS